MPRANLSIALFCATALAGCATPAEQRLSNPTWCVGLQTIVAATPPGGKRSVLLFWPQATRYDPNEIEVSFYAAMQADPLDSVARDFYAAYGRATHYFAMEDIGRRLQQCMGEASAFRRLKSQDVYVGRRSEVQIMASKLACGDNVSPNPCIAIAIRPRQSEPTTP